MVVLAVDVGGDCPTHRDKARSWYDRRKESARQERIDNVGKGNSRLASENSGLRVKTQHSIQSREIDEPARSVQRRVAIRAARTTREQLMRIGGDDLAKLRSRLRAINFAQVCGIAAPSGERCALEARSRRMCGVVGVVRLRHVNSRPDRLTGSGDCRNAPTRHVISRRIVRRARRSPDKLTRLPRYCPDMSRIVLIFPAPSIFMSNGRSLPVTGSHALRSILKMFAP